MHIRTTGSVLAVAALCACGADPETDTPRDAPWRHGVRIPAEEQAAGDAVRGHDTLVNGNYMSCGVPYRLWSDPSLGPVFQRAYGVEDAERLAGRDAKNADMPYSLNAFTAADGAEVVNGNCLTCHAGRFDGQLIVGLGNSALDLTAGIGGGAPADALTPELMDAFGLTDTEQAHMQKITRLARVAAPETKMRTVGNNWAEALTAVLVAHHDPDTLAWSDEALIEVVVRGENGEPLTDAVLTSDPPPWWREHRKNALFYNGMARGDHGGTMALATAVCVDNVSEAERVDELFRDIQAYIASLRAPVYARTIDRELADRGKRIFERDCAGCHGTADSYPNLLIPLDVIGTDPAVANAGVVHAPELLDWYNRSFYGRITRMEPDNPFPGYVAPPLEGVWATAPFLHNASVPSVELVLNSRKRPRYWKRVDFDDRNFDEQALGWPWIEVPYSQAEAPESERKYIYDTTYFSQSNAGHTFGDHLSDAERRAVLEHLKTL
jgi:mono/diheme cytochrome c family protein